MDKSYLKWTIGLYYYFATRMIKSSQELIKQYLQHKS